jgi:hypothetical protein
MPREAAIELIRHAAGQDARGLADFTQELAAEVDATNDPLFAYVSNLFSSVVAGRLPPSLDPADEALFAAIRHMDLAPTPEESVSELLAISPGLLEVVRLVQSRSWEDQRSTKEVVADLDRCIGDRLGCTSTSDDPLLRLDVSRAVFRDYLLTLTGRSPEDRRDG